MLSVANIHYSISGRALLSDVSLQLQAGQILALIGPNGAGKTTLLKVLLGDLIAQSGAMSFAGMPLSQWSLAQRAKHIAVLPQLSLLSFPYTVKEVVALGRTPHNSGALADEKIVSEAMEAMDIAALRHRPYTQLSGGEKQRTQLARVMAQIWRTEDAEQRLLILDEPTSSLDLGHKQQLMRAVQLFAAQGAAVIMVEHDLSVAVNYAQFLLALHNGRCVAYGAVNDVFNQALVQQLFGADVHVLSDPATGKTGISL